MAVVSQDDQVYSAVSGPSRVILQLYKNNRRPGTLAAKLEVEILQQPLTLNWQPDFLVNLHYDHYDAVTVAQCHLNFEHFCNLLAELRCLSNFSHTLYSS